MLVYCHMPKEFLSTPSARRATRHDCRKDRSCLISIHALREEGDARRSARAERPDDFYPRPPRGGRHPRLSLLDEHREISIHALREEGDFPVPQPDSLTRISIHALREEGDLRTSMGTTAGWRFLSTPSARRATHVICHPPSGGRHFYPRPPRGGRHYHRFALPIFQ